MGKEPKSRKHAGPQRAVHEQRKDHACSQQQQQQQQQPQPQILDKKVRALAKIRAIIRTLPCAEPHLAVARC